MELKETLKVKAQEEPAGIQGQSAVSQPISLEQKFNAQLKKMETEIKRALPKHMTADRFSRIVLTEIRRNPKLLQVMNDAPVTLWSAILLSAQLGIDLTPSLGQGYIIPYNRNQQVDGKWVKKCEAQFQLGYRGLLDLVRRSGLITSVTCEVVHENDEFDFCISPTNDTFSHKPFVKGDRGAPYLYYMIAKFSDGGYHIEWMTKDDVDKIKSRSKSPNVGPWVTDYDEMAKKTVIKRASKKLPLSVEAQKQISNDEVIKRDITEDILEWQQDESVYDIDTQDQNLEIKGE